MLLRTLPTLLLAATAVQGLNDASPFFLLSSEPLRRRDFSSKQIATAHDVEEGLITTLNSCTQRLFFVSQPGITAEDLQDARAMPKLRKRMAEGQGDVIEVAQVLGQVDTEDVARRIGQACDGREAEHGAHTINFGVPPRHGHERVEELAKNDAALDDFIRDMNPTDQPAVIIFTTTPLSRDDSINHQDLPYEMDEPYPSPLHTDLKRDLNHQKKQYRRQSNSTDNSQSGLPLFEKYQFLTPGIFMGLTVSLLLFIILYVGVSAIAGLDVSYMAFSREMGPQAQGKGKQQ